MRRRFGNLKTADDDRKFAAKDNSTAGDVDPSVNVRVVKILQSRFYPYALEAISVGFTGRRLWTRLAIHTANIATLWGRQQLSYAEPEFAARVATPNPDSFWAGKCDALLPLSRCTTPPRRNDKQQEQNPAGDAKRQFSDCVLIVLLDRPRDRPRKSTERKRQKADEPRHFEFVGEGSTKEDRYPAATFAKNSPKDGFCHR